MRPKFITLLLASAATILLGGCFGFGQTEPGKLDYPGDVITTTFESAELGISFAYPLTWGTAVTEDASAQRAFIMFEPACTENCKGLFIDVDNIESLDGYLKTLNESVGGTIESIEHNGMLVTKIEKHTSYREEFVLQIHNKINKLYSFRLSAPGPWTLEPDEARQAEWESAEKDFNRIIATFKEIPVVKKELAQMPTDGPQYRFDSCGGLSKYASEDFYADFEQKLGEMDRYTDPINRSRFGATKIQVGDITETCYSSAGELLIGLVKGNFCEFGTIIRYETGTGKISLSDNRPARSLSGGNECDAGLSGFGKRKGHVIEVFAAFGDAGLSVEQTLNYDFTNGVLYLKKSCEKMADSTTAAECTEY